MSKPLISEEDPLIMYLVVKESLNMSIGKTAAQCSHASQMLMQKYFSLDINARNPNMPLNLMSQEALSLFDEWLSSSFRKVVLRADDKEFEKIKQELPSDNIVVVTDNGLTEVVPGSETVIGIFPMLKSQAPKFIKRLQLLK